MSVIEAHRWAIFALLRENGRATISSIAETIGLPRASVSEIVDHAVKDQQIRLTATVNPDFLGITRCSYVLLETAGPSDPILSALNAMDETCFVSATAGVYGVDTEIRTRSDEHHARVLNRIRAIPGVQSITCNGYEKILVNIDSPVPQSPVQNVSLDRVDRLLLIELEKNCRSTHRELGLAVGVSAAIVRNRLQRLLAHEVVKLVGLPVRAKQEGPPPLGVGIQLRSEITEQLLAFVLQIKPEFLAIASGAYDLIMTISAETPELLLQKIDVLRAHEKISRLDAWSHLSITKEQYGADALIRSVSEL